MKKNIILTVLTVVLLFSSCKNEDIAMLRKVNFIVDPSEVISGFTYEVVEGELESFTPGYELRVHLLVYDEMGYLVASDVQYLSNYQDIMNPSLTLWDGEYTAVAITDVVKYDGEVTSNNWKIAETGRLSSLKISDTGNLGGKDKILGITNYHFNVSEESVNHTIRVKPAGCLLLVKASNIHYYNTVVRYKLGMNKSASYCTFNNDGSYVVTVKDSEENYEWHSGYFEPQDYNSYDECHYYHFVLPLGRTSFQWMGKTDDNIWLYGGDKMSASIGGGEEYLVRFELGSDIKAQMDLVNGGKF